MPVEDAARGIRDADLRAIDEAATLGTDVLVLVCGGLPDGASLPDNANRLDRDLAGARCMVEDGIAAVAPYAQERGVRLGIEPLHPMFAADRSVIVTLGQANAIADALQHSNVGVIVDVYHVWWDPQVEDAIREAGERILGFHVNDWIVPLPDVLAGRGMMGDGVIELKRLRRAVDEVGYTGPIEVEIFNNAIWGMDVGPLLGRMVARQRLRVAL